LQSAKTDSEVQKLAAVIAAQSADLNSVDHEVSQSLASALVVEQAVAPLGLRQTAQIIAGA